MSVSVRMVFTRRLCISSEPPDTCMEFEFEMSQLRCSLTFSVFSLFVRPNTFLLVSSTSFWNSYSVLFSKVRQRSILQPTDALMMRCVP